MDLVGLNIRKGIFSVFYAELYRTMVFKHLMMPFILL